MSLSRSGAVQLMASLDREKQELYQLRLIAFDKARQPEHRPVASCYSTQFSLETVPLRQSS